MLSPFPRAASALLDPSTKAAATKMEKVRIIDTTSIMCCQLNGGCSWDGFHVFSRRLRSEEKT